LDRYHKERQEAVEKDKVKELERKKCLKELTITVDMSKKCTDPKTSQAKHDEIENIISKLKINMSNDSLSARGSPDGIRKSNSILKLREVKSSLATPTYRSGKNSSALKTLDKYAVAVKSILEQRGENGDMLIDKEKLNWYKKNPMVKDKYVPP
jgi:hypothetical protein